MTATVDMPCHQERPSLLSAPNSHENYRGFLNLVYVLLALGSCRLVIENILRYGLLIDFNWPMLFLEDPTNWSSIFLMALMNFFIVFALWLELKLIYMQILNEKSKINWMFIQLLNLIALLVFPVAYIYYHQPNPIGAFAVVWTYTIVFLKLFSYIHVNYQCRQTLLEKKISVCMNQKVTKDLVQYPNNLTIQNLYYFIMVPTLCYQLNFPRSPRIRIGFVLKCLTEILILLSLQYCLGQQWALPILRTIDRPLNQYSMLQNVERILRLALPNHVLWLMLFYVYFHSTLNLLAEILRFGDRLFYCDWWNATDLSEFWNRWNTTVHTFCKRHIYKPLVIEYGLNNFTSVLIVFMISAFFHEYLISVPLRMIRPWSFLAMIIQVPMGIAVKRLKDENKTYGNIAVWVFLILVQPIAILMYIQDLFYRDYVMDRF